MEEQTNQVKEEDDEREVEVLEFSLTGDEIDELLEKLKVLKSTKTSISFDVDEENEFVIHYETAGDIEEKNEDKIEDKKSGESHQLQKSQEEKTQQNQNKSMEIPTLDGVERQ
jgi:hypothetical protein